MISPWIPIPAPLISGCFLCMLEHFNMSESFNISVLVILTLFIDINTKYIEGELKTIENWAFLARFCFLSEKGEFEYEIEYNENQGDLNLLLYYDTENQWPAVYKSNKTCEERESVLNIGQNQIVNLTARFETYREASGCNFLQEPTTTARTYTIVVPTLPPVKTKMKRPQGIESVTQSSRNISVATEKIVSSTEHDTTENSMSTEEASFSTLTNIEYTSYSSTEEANRFSTPGYTEEISRNHSRTKRSLGYSNQNKRYVRRGRIVKCHNARMFRTSRERWWFIAVSNCNGSKGIQLKYRILMTNGLPGDYWHEHFSADEFYILPVLMAFTIAYSFLMLGIVVCSIELKSRQLLHTTYKIFVFSTIVQLFGILFVSSCYLKLAIMGQLETKIKRFGMILMSISETSFVLLLLLLAKGYTITRARLPLSASIKLTIFMCVYAVIYLSLFIYEAKVFDPGEVLYLYESPAGYGLIILRVLAWCMFIYSTIFTLKYYPEKGNFYYPFNVFGTIWFIAGPAFILSANTYIDKWVRESVVCAVLLFISFGGHLMFLILTTPSVANKNFPYHVRTTQIGIMEQTGNDGTSTMAQFGHHVYEPTMREQTVIIPLTRRTEEIFEEMCNQNSSLRNGTSEGHQNGYQEQNTRDLMLENVLNWSLAKNVPAIEMPNFERTASINSRMGTNGHMLNISSRESSFRETQTRPQFDDYIKEVPIELFTVSKMIVTTNTLRKKNTQPDDSD